MSFSKFFRKFRILVKIGDWLNQRQVARAGVMAGLAVIHRCATHMEDPPFKRLHCQSCGGDRNFALWFDGAYHCLSDLMAMPQVVVRVGCMSCRATTMHFVDMDGGTHCNPCWAYRAQETMQRRREALMASPAPDAAIVMVPAPAARTSASHRLVSRSDESGLQQLPS